MLTGGDDRRTFGAYVRVRAGAPRLCHPAADAGDRAGSGGAHRTGRYGGGGRLSLSSADGVSILGGLFPVDADAPAARSDAGANLGSGPAGLWRAFAVRVFPPSAGHSGSAGVSCHNRSRVGALTADA